MNALLSLEERHSLNNLFLFRIIKWTMALVLLVLLLFLRDKRGGLIHATAFQHGERDLKKHEST